MFTFTIPQSEPRGLWSQTLRKYDTTDARTRVPKPAKYLANVFRKETARESLVDFAIPFDCFFKILNISEKGWLEIARNRSKQFHLEFQNVKYGNKRLSLNHRMTVIQTGNDRRLNVKSRSIYHLEHTWQRTFLIKNRFLYLSTVFNFAAWLFCFVDSLHKRVDGFFWVQRPVERSLVDRVPNPHLTVSVFQLTNHFVVDTFVENLMGEGKSDL